MKIKLILLSILILIIALVGCYKAPDYINWEARANNYFAIMKKEGLSVSDFTSVQVSKGSSIGLKFGSFEVKSAKGDDLLKASSMSFEISWFDLLSGTISPQNVALEGATLNIDLDDQNGFKLLYSSAGGSISSVSLTDASIDLTYNNKSTTVTGVTSNIVFSSSKIQSSGTISSTENLVNYNFSTDSSNIVLDISQDGAYSFAYTGTFNGDILNPISDGNIAIDVQNLTAASFVPSMIFPYISKQIAGEINSEDIKISGKMSVANKKISADNLVIDGGNLIKGSVKVSYDFSNNMLCSMDVNLDSLNIEKKQVSSTETTAGTVTTLTGPSTLALAIYTEPEFFTLSAISMFDVDMNIAIKNMDVNSYKINDLAANFTIKNGIFTLNNFATNFPDGTKLSLTDFASQNVTNIDVLVGNMQLSGSNLATTLSLFGVPENYINFIQDSSYNLTAKVIMSPMEVTFYGFNIDVGKVDANANQAKIFGRWTVQNHDPKLGKYNIELNLQNFNFTNINDNSVAQMLNSILLNSNNANYYTNFVPFRQITTNGTLTFAVTNSKVNNSSISNISSQVSFAPSSLDFQNLQIKTDLLQCSGEIKIDAVSLRPNIIFNITADSIDLDKMLPSFQPAITNTTIASTTSPAAAVTATTASTATPATAVTATTASITAPAASISTSVSAATSTTATAGDEQQNGISKNFNNDPNSIWSRNGFNYFRAEKFDGTWALKVNKFVFFGGELDNLQLSLKSLNNTIYIESFDAGFLDGTLDVKGSVTRNEDQLSASLSAAFNDFTLSKMELPTNLGGGIGGAASMSGSVVTNGKSPFDLVSNATSAVTVAIRGAEFNKFDITKLIAITTLGDNTIDKTNAIEKLAEAYDSGTTPVNSIDGYIIISKGLANTQNMTFSQSFSNGTIAASVDMRYLLLNSLLTINFRPTINELLSLSINYQGGSSNLTKTVSDDAVIQYVRSIYNIPIPKSELEAERIKNSQYIYQKVTD